jgi:hypothetical protein
MNKLNVQPQTPSFPVDYASLPGHPVQHLIVLITEDLDAAATRRIWEVANASCTDVQLVSLCNDPAQEPGLRRKLVTMASLLHHGRVTADWNIHFGTNWVDVIKQNFQPDDMIVCFAEQRAGILHRPLHQILQSTLENPLYMMSGLYSGDRPQSNWLSETLGWSGSLAILVAACLLQIKIVSLSDEWFQTILLILSVIAEIWLIGAWNHLFR